jgi:phage-related protein
MSFGEFIFKGIHSSTYGVKETPSSKVLSPLKRRNIITIPGRLSGFVQEDGGYEPRVESIICSYGLQYGVDIHDQVRDIAGWLDGIGELTFDYEPSRHYLAYVSSPPSLVTMLEFSQFQVEFTMVNPFAYETAVQQKDLISASGPNNIMTITTEGTAKTPVRIVIKNNTNSKITRLKIYHKFIES